jgi:hypothetical protein
MGPSGGRPGTRDADCNLRVIYCKHGCLLTRRRFIFKERVIQEADASKIGLHREPANVVVQREGASNRRADEDRGVLPIPKADYVKNRLCYSMTASTLWEIRSSSLANAPLSIAAESP